MFRISTCFDNSRRILYHPIPLATRLCRIHYTPIRYNLIKRAKEQEPCLPPPPPPPRGPRERLPCPPPPPPPPKKPKDDRVFWAALALLFIAGAIATVAKDSPEFRDWLTIRAPWFDDFVAFMYQENMTYKEWFTQWYKGWKEYFVPCEEKKPIEEARPIHVSHKKEKVKEEGKKEELEEECNVGDEECCERHKKMLEERKKRQEREVIVEEKKKEIKEDIVEEVIIVEEEVQEEVTEEVVEEEEEVEEKKEQDPCQKPVPSVMYDICDYEECLKEHGDACVANYITARDACGYYTRCVQETMDNFKPGAMEKLQAIREERDELLKQSFDNIKESKPELDEIIRYFDCGVKAPKKEMDETRKLIEEYQNKIKIIDMEYKFEKEKCDALDEQCAMVEENVSEYINENEAMFSPLKYNQKKPQFKGDPDLFLIHTLRHRKKLENDLKNESEAMAARSERAMETVRKTDQNNKHLKNGMKKRKSELDKDYQNRAADQKAANDRKLKNSLQAQKDKHEAALNEKIAQKEQEAEENLDQYVAEKVNEEKAKWDVERQAMAAKVKEVEDKLEERLKVDRETKRSQQLWNAGSSLLDATKKGKYKRVRVNKELEAIEKAADKDDELVGNVMKSIPYSVREDGVVPESQLKDSYHSMESVAKKVALVEGDGGPLPIYWLSWLQYFLLSPRSSGIPQAEIDNPPKEPAKNLDTFDLLERARYYVGQGNLPAALAYVGSLEGASRAAADTWYQNAKSHLETKQAAEAIVAHASSMGVQNV